MLRLNIRESIDVIQYRTHDFSSKEYVGSNIFNSTLFTDAIYITPVGASPSDLTKDISFYINDIFHYLYQLPSSQT